MKVYKKLSAIFSFVLILLLSISLSGCLATAQQHREAISDPTDKLTVGTVQKEIKKGMSGAEVAIVLGAPNIVTKDKSEVETWIYDKISTEYIYSSGSAGIGSLVIGVASIIGAGSGSVSSSSGASSKNQKTLTIIIKFTEGVVSEYTYHTSSF